VKGGRRGLIGSKTITTGCDAQAFELAAPQLQQAVGYEQLLATVVPT
jgi:hypothetical protein